MATQVLKVCDICGKPTEQESLTFGWSLINYEIDLCPAHQEQMAEVMEVAASKGRRLGAPPRSLTVEPPPLPARQQASTAEVRAWAKEKGIKVSPRGRVPDDVFEKYLAERG